jgi:flavin reductase (DIM6/NTAB) family NADH-FMN oxidoreductase RutF
MSLDKAAFRSALGRFATGVVVVTADSKVGDPVAMTVSSFNTVSLDPPLVLFSIVKSAYSLPALLAAPYFAVSVLGEDQMDLSLRFCFGGARKMADIELARGKTGCPLIRPALAAFECLPYATYEGGDHLIIVGRVDSFEATPDGDPLVFYRGGYHAIAAPLPTISR